LPVRAWARTNNYYTAISQALKDKGHLNELGRPFNHKSIRVMLTKRA